MSMIGILSLLCHTPQRLGSCRWSWIRCDDHGLCLIQHWLPSNCGTLIGSKDIHILASGANYASSSRINGRYHDLDSLTSPPRLPLMILGPVHHETPSTGQATRKTESNLPQTSFASHRKDKSIGPFPHDRGRQ